MAEYKILDVSCHNGNVDFTQVKKAGYTGVILRAGFGKSITQKDKCFDTYYKDAKLAGLNVGAYWYSYSKTSSAALLEAKTFLQAIKDCQLELPCYYDIEDKTQVSLSKTICTEMANTFCKYLEDNKYWAGVYSYDSFFGSNLDMSIQSRYAIWVARVDGRKPQFCKTYQGWQNSWVVKIPNHTCDFDSSVFTVDYSTLIKSKKLNGVDNLSNISTTPTSNISTIPKTIVSPYMGKFKVSQEFKGTTHQGLDLVGIDSKNLYSTTDGIVEVASNLDPTGFGTYVRILASNGYRYYYGHMSSVNVKVGDKVKIGDLIGVEGSTGHSTGSHCHYEVRKTLDKSSFADINEISGIPNVLGIYNDISIKNDISLYKLTVIKENMNETEANQLKIKLNALGLTNVKIEKV